MLRYHVDPPSPRGSLRTVSAGGRINGGVPQGRPPSLSLRAWARKISNSEVVFLRAIAREISSLVGDIIPYCLKIFRCPLGKRKCSDESVKNGGP